MMRVQQIVTTSIALVAATGCHAFMTTSSRPLGGPAFVGSTSQSTVASPLCAHFPRNGKVSFVSSDKTVLFSTMGVDDSSSTYGIEGPKKRRPRGAEDLIDPEKELSKYIQAPEPVPARPNLEGNVIVSGWVNSKERTDQVVFDLLNHEEAAFKFSTITAFVDDEKFAKKRLLGRSARYTGLLDKLAFAEAESAGALPTVAQLEGVSNWVAHVPVDAGSPSAALDKIKEIANVASGADSVENVAVLLSNSGVLPDDIAACVSSIEALDKMGDKKAFTVVAVGELEDKPEGSKPYLISDFGTKEGVIPTDGKMSRDESVRLITECLALESGMDKALSFTEVVETKDSPAATLIKGLREAGYTRPQEINYMIVAGVTNYTKAIEEYKAKIYELENPDPEKLRLEKEEADRKDKEAFEKSQVEYEERKKKEIEEIARSWAKREYFRKSMSGNMGMTEEEYIESVWERAMFEGDLKYRMMHGGKTDERAELSEFLAKQEAKKQTALKRAREALEGQLGDGSVVVDAKKLQDDDDEDDDDDE